MHIGGTTIHGLLQMNAECESKVDDESEAVKRFQSITGIIFDEYTMIDVKVWSALKRSVKDVP